MYDENSFLFQEYFPDDYNREQLVNGYKNFSNSNLKTNDILFDIYQVSKCGMLFDMTRRVLYRNDFQTLHPNNIIDNLNNFVKYLKQFSYKKIIVKHCVNHGLSLQGEIDLLADDTIYEIKASQYTTISKEYILQVLGYAALMKVAQNVEINSIAFYNPLIGKIFIYDISNWPFSQQYIKFLVDKAISQAASKSNGVKQSEYEEQKQVNDLKIITDYDQLSRNQDNQNVLSNKGIQNSQINFNEISSQIQQQIYEEKNYTKPIFNISEFSQPQNKQKATFNNPSSIQTKKIVQTNSKSTINSYRSVNSEAQQGKPINVYKRFKKYVHNEQIQLEKQSKKPTKLFIQSDGREIVNKEDFDDIENLQQYQKKRILQESQISNQPTSNKFSQGIEKILSQIDDIKECQIIEID